MTKEITITAAQIEEMLGMHATAERRLEKAIERGSNNEDLYRAECLTIERMLDAMGIEWC